jgi:hypothetical protein
MIADVDPISAAKELGASSAQTQLWVFIVVGFFCFAWLVKQLREESAELRRDLREQSKTREESTTQLIRVVDANTAAIRDSNSVLSDVKHQLRRSEETLDKFAS